MVRKLTIVRVRRSQSDNIHQELQWLGNSLGLFSLRDKNSSCFRVFITLVRRAKVSQTISSDEIAEKLHLTRGTVIHHLNRLMDAGIVVKESQGYILRDTNLERVVGRIKHDLDMAMNDLMEVAKDVDEKLG
jgi:predicted transcriptional regulator